MEKMKDVETGTEVLKEEVKTARRSAKDQKAAEVAAAEEALAVEVAKKKLSHTPVADTPPLRFDQLPEVKPREKVEVNIKSLLEAGVHFGHQTARWNPKMAPYIHSSRNGIHIINLPMSVSCFEVARKKIVEVASRGGSVLFVGTKKQAQDAVVEEATRCGAYYVSRRWLGGMLTNFQTIRKSIDRMNKLEEILVEEDTALRSGEGSKYTKKERLMMTREREKLHFSLGGIRTMYGAPSLLFVIDVKREAIALQEAARLDIPVVALVDTNCNPTNVDFPIPSNDDGTRAVRFFCAAVADAILEGKEVFKERISAQKRDEVVKAKPKPGKKAAAAATEQAETAAPEAAVEAASSEPL